MKISGKQRAFNDVVRHLRKQGKKSYGKYDKPGVLGEKEGCMYRAPDGCKCAVGGIMPDEVYKPEMETRGLHAKELDPFMEWAKQEYGNDVDPSFFRDLQLIHDDSSVFMWEVGFQNFARDYNLTYSPA